MRRINEPSSMDDLGELDFTIDFSGKEESKTKSEEGHSMASGWAPVATSGSSHDDENTSKWKTSNQFLIDLSHTFRLGFQSKHLDGPSHSHFV